MPVYQWFSNWYKCVMVSIGVSCTQLNTWFVCKLLANLTDINVIINGQYQHRSWYAKTKRHQQFSCLFRALPITCFMKRDSSFCRRRGKSKLHSRSYGTEIWRSIRRNEHRIKKLKCLKTWILSIHERGYWKYPIQTSHPKGHTIRPYLRTWFLSSNKTSSTIVCNL